MRVEKPYVFNYNNCRYHLLHKGTGRNVRIEIREKVFIMEKRKTIGIIILCGFAAITVFHILHHVLFCRYKGVPGKSHCGVCGHRRVCQKYHK